jgi:crotonobetainyl-CoA:carnitine CoA-transferase CaiB-like acyl-CoA transferase
VTGAVESCRARGIAAIAVLGRDEVYTSAALDQNGCWVVVDDDDLGEVRVMRGYSDWDGVAPRRRAVMHTADRDTDAVLGEVSARD